jgi:mannosyltransferase
MNTTRPEPRPPAGVAIGAALLLAAAAILPFIGRASLSNDEGWSLAFARLPWPTLWTATHHLDAVFLPYYALLHVWLALGDSAALLRFPSALAILASLPVAYAIARRLFDPVVAAVAVLLLACNPFLVFHAKDARPYGLAFLLCAVATLAFLRVLESPTRANGFAYALAAALAVYAHAFGAFVIVAHAASTPVLPRAAGAPRVVALALFGALVACAPLVALIHTAGSAQIGWIAHPGPRDWLELVKDLAGGRIALAAFVFGCAVMLVRARMGRPRAAFDAVVLWFAVPLALLAIVSYAVEPVSISRYAIFCVLPLTLATAAAIGEFRRPLVVVATLFLLAVSARIVWTQRSEDAENYRAAAAYIAAHAAPGDVVAAPEAAFAFAAAQTAVPNVPPLIYPTATWQFWLGPQPLSAIAGTQLAHARTVWVVRRGYHQRRPQPAASAALETLLAPDFAPAGETDFSYAGVVRYVRVKAATALRRS